MIFLTKKISSQTPNLQACERTWAARARSLRSELRHHKQHAAAGFQQLIISLWQQYKCVGMGLNVEVYRIMVPQVMLYR